MAVVSDTHEINLKWPTDEEPPSRDERLGDMYFQLGYEGPSEQAAEYHFARFMQALGHDPLGNHHLEHTPVRVTDMYRELLGGGEPFTFTTFEAEDTGPVLMVDIPFVSFCAHHFLPFTGKAHVAYTPDGKVAGLSKLARAVQTSAAKPHVQEDLTNEILDVIKKNLEPTGVAVMVQARHSCMELRGPKAVGALTTTMATVGTFRNDAALRAEFLQACHGAR